MDLTSFKLKSFSVHKCFFLIICILFVSLCAFWVICDHYKMGPTALHRQSLKTDEETGPPACIIPQTPVMPMYLKKKFRPKERYETVQNCGYERKLFELRDEKTVVLTEEAIDAGPCCLQEILRGRGDYRFILSECYPIKDKMALRGIESFLVKCGGKFLNVDSSITPKIEITDKLNHWKRIPRKEHPYSVFLFGFDSLSRAHAYRSFKKSIPFMKELGFLDFNSYHSTSDSTLTNFIAFLMGIPRPIIRKKCAKNWNTPFDNCPLVWNDFSRANYVTSYVEDGDQSFNWGGDAGFRRRQPTDYYIHPMFLALRQLRRQRLNELRSKNPNKTIRLEQGCTSTETIPEFMLRHQLRFFKQMAKVPFFSFLFLAYPFHENAKYAFPPLDHVFLDFLQGLSTNTELLRKSFIIGLGDHGDRRSMYYSNVIESYIERGVPPLFIRPPDQFREEFPHLYENLKSNSRLYVTPYDIHQTFVHIMKLKGTYSATLKTYGDDSVSARAINKSSILVPLSPSRICENTFISEKYCLCNIPYGNNTRSMSKMKIHSEPFKRTVADFVISQLNKKVQQSKYKEVCQQWKLRSHKLPTLTVLSLRGQDAEILVSISLDPYGASFDVRLRAQKRSWDITKSKLLPDVGFSRTSTYGNMSWCVGTATDEDKEMKELCACVKQK